MESSDAETGMVDCSVGTIVWVRRRNGSWWPGKILGPDELSASHLMSPRSGTPVKLLGREDASVDWYNLEKSKRVKPFRCGEFDDCIERAEASQGMPPKKREKYARREDAILHALELEKQVLEKRYGKQSNGLMNITPELCVDDKRKGQLDDNVQAPSFRELVPFKHNKNGSHSHGVIGPENTLTVGSKKVVEKRKRAQEGNNIMIEESVGKRRDRHRPLVQVLQSSAKLQPNTKAADGGGGEEQRETHPPDQQVEVEVQVEVEKIALNLSNGNSSGSNEDTETDSSGTESLMSDTYDDAMAALSGEDMEFIPKAKEKEKVIGRCEGQGEDSDDESGVADDSIVSKWQLKGKRNSRSLRKRSSNSNSRQWMMGFKGEDMGYSNSYMSCWDDEAQREHGSWDGMLIDVEVGVQSGYQREHVPMISLMSKLNDKAIVGHPIPIQPLQDGASDIILVSESSLASSADWRTKCRVSRPPHLSTLEEEEEDEEEEEEEDGYSYYDEEEDAKRSLKGRKKPQRRSTSSCTSQKIRTLSSIGDMKEAGERTMKPESLPKGTAVACIPVKLVFSRLHEELLAPRHAV